MSNSLSAERNYIYDFDSAAAAKAAQSQALAAGASVIANSEPPVLSLTVLACDGVDPVVDQIMRAAGGTPRR